MCIRDRPYRGQIRQEFQTSSWLEYQQRTKWRNYSGSYDFLKAATRRGHHVEHGMLSQNHPHTVNACKSQKLHWNNKPAVIIVFLFRFFNIYMSLRMTRLVNESRQEKKTEKKSGRCTPSLQLWCGLVKDELFMDFCKISTLTETSPIKKLKFSAKGHIAGISSVARFLSRFSYVKPAL